MATAYNTEYTDEDYARRMENRLAPCRCNIHSCLAAGMYVAACLAAGIGLVIMVIDKSVYGHCRFLSILNQTDNLILVGTLFHWVVKHKPVPLLTAGMLC